MQPPHSSVHIKQSGCILGEFFSPPHTHTTTAHSLLFVTNDGRAARFHRRPSAAGTDSRRCAAAAPAAARRWRSPPHPTRSGRLALRGVVPPAVHHLPAAGERAHHHRRQAGRRGLGGRQLDRADGGHRPVILPGPHHPGIVLLLLPLLLLLLLRCHPPALPSPGVLTGNGHRAGRRTTTRR